MGQRIGQEMLPARLQFFTNLPGTVSRFIGISAFIRGRRALRISVTITTTTTTIGAEGATEWRGKRRKISRRTGALVICSKVPVKSPTWSSIYHLAALRVFRDISVLRALARSRARARACASNVVRVVNYPLARMGARTRSRCSRKLVVEKH